MRLTTFLLIVSIVQVSAITYGQKVSLSAKNVPITRIFSQIKSQTGFDFVFTGSLLKNSKPVTIDVQNADLDAVLKKVFDGQQLEYTIEDKSVVISKKTPSFLDKVVDAFTPPINVSGVVYDEKGQPLPGATVKIKGLKQSVVTDKEGRFYLPGVDDKAVLVVSYVGYQDQDFAAKEGVSVHMELKSDELKEVVVAYGKTTQQALTGSVTVVKGEQIENLPNRSFDRSLQGMVPGLLVTSGNGQPGGGLSNFVLRGISTAADPFYNGTVSRTPLIVIDGVPISQDPVKVTVNFGEETPINNPVAQLNPSDIESISVLKDASAVALYGSKASNGVILVTTKKGKSGNTTFSFKSQADIAQQLTNKQKVLDQQQYLTLLYDTYRNTPRVVNNVPTPWTDADIMADLKGMFPVRTDGSFYPQPDWVGLIYKDNAITTTNEISASGGTDKSTYYLNLENLNQDGIVRNTGYDRTSARLNFENKPAVWFKYGLNTNLSYNKQRYSSTNEGINGISYANTMSPLNPARLENGTLIENYKWGTPIPGVFMPSSVASIEYNVNQNVSYRGLNKIYAEINFLKYLSLSSNFGIDYMQTEAKEKNDPRLVSPEGVIGEGSIIERSVRRSNLISTNMLKAANFLKGPHSLDALFGYEFQIQNQKTLGVSVTNLSQPYFEEITNPTPSRIKAFDGTRYKETLLSYFGQVNYNLKEKYYLSGSIRSDGSSKFGDRKRFGTYWSVGAGWVLSEENFLKPANPVLNFLKLRGSFGAAGNSSAITASTQFDVVDIWRYYNEAAAVPSTRPGNPDIRWERTFSVDLGLEASMFDNRVKLTADIYQRNTNDLIYQVDLVPSTGYYSVLSNIGKMQNKGMEVFASVEAVRNKAFNWNIAATWSTNQNKLVKANVPAATLKTDFIANQEGRNFNSFYLVRWAGVNPDNGKPQWLDAAGNASETYSDENLSFVGKPQPDGFGTLTNNFKVGSFQLSAMLYYQYGYQIFNRTMQSLLNDGATPHINQLTGALDYWTGPGDVAKNPRRSLNNTDRGNRASTRYLFDGDYIRLKNVTLQYQLPAEWVKHIHLRQASIFVQGSNLALWTKYPGQDPDDINAFGTVNFAYPNQRTYSLGVNVNF